MKMKSDNDIVIFTRFKKFFYIAAKIAGIAPFTIRDDKLYPTTIMNRVYSLILVAVCVLWGLVMIYQKLSDNARQCQVYCFVYSFAILVNFISVVSCLLTLNFKSERIIEIIMRFRAFGERLKSLKTTKKDREIFKSYTVKIVVTNVAVLGMTMTLNFIINLNYYIPTLSEFTQIGLSVIYFQRHNAIMIFAWIIDCINQGFQHLNNELESLIQTDCERLQRTRLLAYRTGNIQSLANRASRGRTIRYSMERIAEIRSLHKELCGILESTAEFFTTPLLWILGAQFIRVLLISYAVYKYLVSSVDFLTPTASNHTTLFHLIIRTLIIGTEIYCVTDVCALACRMVRKKTKIIIKIRKQQTNR